MKVYATIFSNEELLVQVTVSPRSSNQEQNKQRTPEEERLLKKYTSKIGQQSLIFDPMVALAVSGSTKETRANRIVFNIRYTYQVMSTIMAVYEDMISNRTSGIYVKTENGLLIDRAAAEAKSRKIPTFAHELRVRPDVYVSKSGESTRGLNFSSDMGYIGTLSHVDARLLIESLEHFDATTYAMVIGMAEQLGTMDTKLDIMKGELDEVRRDVKMLVANSNIDVTRNAPWHPTK